MNSKHLLVPALVGSVVFSACSPGVEKGLPSISNKPFAGKFHGNLPSMHIVQPGETLASIADYYYGKEKRTDGIRAILSANPQLRGQHPLGSLQLTIPKLP